MCISSHVVEDNEHSLFRVRAALCYWAPSEWSWRADLWVARLLISTLAEVFQECVSSVTILVTFQHWIETKQQMLLIEFSAAMLLVTCWHCHELYYYMTLKQSWRGGNKSEEGIKRTYNLKNNLNFRSLCKTSYELTCNNVVC